MQSLNNGKNCEVTIDELLCSSLFLECKNSQSLSMTRSTKRSPCHHPLIGTTLQGTGTVVAEIPVLPVLASLQIKAAKAKSIVYRKVVGSPQNPLSR